MSRRPAITGSRPPAFLSRARLAAELDLGETTVDDLVKLGVLPKPIRLGGSVRWCWATVEAAITTTGAAADGADPFMKALNDEAAA